MPIAFFNEDVPMPAVKKTEIRKWVTDVAARYGKKVDEISYIFCNDDKILEINRQYLDHDYYTDIITFDYSEKKKISGDIFISLDTVQSNATKYQQPYLTELYRVIIHGILHLCGINDKSPAERAQMEAAENEALTHIEI